MRLKRLKYLLGMGGSAGERILSAVAIVAGFIIGLYGSRFLIDLM